MTIRDKTVGHNDVPTPKPFDDELLSAYLDEQLSDEERARVESYLAENVEARQLLDELAAVSGMVRSLPELTVDDRFSADVLAAAEHSRYRPRLAGGTASSNETDPIPISVGRSARGWVWAALAVAAALLVMFLNGEWPGGDRLDEKLEVAEVDESTDAGAAASMDREKPMDDRRAPTMEADAFAKPAEERFAKDDGERGIAGGVDALAKPAARVLAETETTAEAEKGRGGVDGKGGPTVPAPEPLAANQPAAPQSKSHGLWAGRVGGRRSVPGNAPEGVQTAKAAPRRSEQVPSAMRAAAIRGPAIEQNKEIQFFFAANNIQLAKDEPVLVVQVDLTPEATRNQAFDAVLLNNSISYKDDVDPLASALEDKADKRAADAVPKNAAAGPYEVVLVSAMPIQLHAALNELNNDRGNYNQLQIAPSNEMGETTNVWDQYNRGQVFGEPLKRRQASAKARSPNRASSVQQPAPDGAGGMVGGGMGGGGRLGSADANARQQQADEQTQGRAWRFRVNQGQRGRKTPEGDRYGAPQDSYSEQGDFEQESAIRQERAHSGERPSTQLGRQFRFSLGDEFSGEGRLIERRTAQETTQGRIWAVFLLRVVPQQAEAAAQEPADKP